MHQTQLAFLLTASTLLGACGSTRTDPDIGLRWELLRGPRVLCVVAHPDDEIAFAGTLFKTTTHLGGTCDMLVITNGEGGYKYSTLGERIYGAALTDPRVGRARLPSIRKAELREGSDVLGVRSLYFLDQKDHRYTQDPTEVLAPDADVWDLALVRREIARVLRTGNYDFVLTHLPSPTTHGHHQAATILALEALAEMPEEARPVALGAWPSGRAAERPEPNLELHGFPITRLCADAGPYTFDRTQPFGYRDRLSYQIVVNWAIAAHKSQGTFQLMMNRWEWETFYPYALNRSGHDELTARWFGSLSEPQFAALEYDENGEVRK